MPLFVSMSIALTAGTVGDGSGVGSGVGSAAAVAINNE
jgi:hypothetical protein